MADDNQPDDQQLSIAGALQQARAYVAYAAAALRNQPPADPTDVHAICVEAAELESAVQWCAAAAVAGRGGQLTVTIVDRNGRIRVTGG